MKDNEKVLTVTTVNGMQVSTIPIGSVIDVGTGETFNVISSESLQLSATGEYLCVNENNGGAGEKVAPWHSFIPNEVGPEMKIQDEGAALSEEDEDLPKPCEYNEMARKSVLPIRCKNTSAELYKTKFGSGGRGKCIHLNDQWFTPTEFEAFCGRASSKDWKRSIRFGGRSIQVLIDDNVLRLHATSCTCVTCTDDESAAGPVRFFKKYARRSKRSSGKLKRKKINNSSTEHVDDSESDDPGYADSPPSPTPSLEGEYDCAIPPIEDIENESFGETINRLNKMSSTMLKLAQNMKSYAKIVEDKFAKEVQNFAQSPPNTAYRDDSLHLAQPSTESHRKNMIATDDEEFKRCANCDRVAYMECSMCHLTKYCTPFCQKKDWATHQKDCNRQSDFTLIMNI